MQNILIINENADHKKMSKNHYSLTKGENVAHYLALQQGLTVYFLTEGNSEIINNIHYTNKITKDFLKNIHYVLFIRETNIHIILERYKELKEILDTKSIKIGIKGDSVSWMKNKELRDWVLKNYNKDLYEWGYNFFDIIYVQQQKSLSPAQKLLKKDPLKKLKTSKMGVPDKIIDFSCIENNFLTTKYVNAFSENTKNVALLPFKLQSAFKNLSILNEPCKSPIKLIYIGRIKTDNGRIATMMSEIMKELGNNYELHIFPGKFILPDVDVKDYSPKNTVHLQFLRDKIFCNNENVFIHYPFEHDERLNYLVHADIGIDFSPTRPSNILSPYGNSKLLDYCYAGLPVVTEANVGNIELVQDAKNGIVLHDNASVSEYVTAIRIVSKMEINKEYVHKITVAKNNWYDICKNIKHDFEC